jgi:hypothetical protein
MPGFVPARTMRGLYESGFLFFNSVAWGDNGAFLFLMETNLGEEDQKQKEEIFFFEKTR